MESYNRQLLRKTNLYSKILGDLVRISEKELALLAVCPKDFTLVDVLRQNYQISSRLDSTATVLTKLNNEQTIKIKAIQDQSKRQASSRTSDEISKGERFSNEERKLEEATERILSTIKSFERVIENDRLNKIVSESTMIRDKNIEQLAKAAEERSEQFLEKHIKEQLIGRHSQIGIKLQDDDIVDWILLAAMIGVAGFGLFMWKKLKEQSGGILL